jgi:hypothetical protein
MGHHFCLYSLLHLILDLILRLPTSCVAMAPTRSPHSALCRRTEELIGTELARSIRLRGVSRSGAPHPQTEHRGDCSHPIHTSLPASRERKRNNSSTDEHDGAMAIKNSPRYFQIFLALVTEPASEIYVIVIGITL